MSKTRDGFTLGETLIGLALLGVLALFVIPKILQSSQNQQRTLVFKETIGAVNTLLYQGTLTGNLHTNGDNISSYFQTGLNVVQTCNNAIAEGCWIGSSPRTSATTEVNQKGFLLPNGATLCGLDNDPLGQNGFMIDWNGLQPPNIIGQDQLWFSITYNGAVHTGAVQFFDCTKHYPDCSPDNLNAPALFQTLIN